MTVSRIPLAIQQRARTVAKNHSGYCQSQQAYIPAPLEIEYISNYSWKKENGFK